MQRISSVLLLAIAAFIQIPLVASIPVISPWPQVSAGYIQIKDAASGNCWDANTYTIGALITPKACNSVQFTQVFNSSRPVSSSSFVLGVTAGSKSLCVELSSSNVLNVSEY